MPCISQPIFFLRHRRQPWGRLPRPHAALSASQHCGPPGRPDPHGRHPRRCLDPGQDPPVCIIVLAFGSLPGPGGLPPSSAKPAPSSGSRRSPTHVWSCWPHPPTALPPPPPFLEAGGPCLRLAAPLPPGEAGGGGRMGPSNPPGVSPDSFGPRRRRDFYYY